MKNNAFAIDESYPIRIRMNFLQQLGLSVCNQLLCNLDIGLIFMAVDMKPNEHTQSLRIDHTVPKQETTHLSNNFLSSITSCDSTILTR